MQQLIRMPANLVILIGLTGFGFLLLYDVATLKKIKNRFVIAAVGYGLQVYAIFAAALGSKETAVGQWVASAGWLLTLTGAGWLLTLTGAGWLLYCLFLFPPIRRTYLEANGPVLTTDGPYALSRHPGVYGYTAFVIGLALATRSLLLFQCGIIWILTNLGYVFLQDCYIFNVLLAGYQDYRKKTPMLIPSAKSIRRFWETK